jgi:nicotinate phosphoribosyltransferase
VTGSGAATAGLIYKLVARENRAGHLVNVAKQSKDKATVGGRKWAVRRINAEGQAEAEIIGIGEMPTAIGNDRPLLVDLILNGEIVADRDLKSARRRYETSLAELPAKARQLSRGEPVITTIYENSPS